MESAKKKSNIWFEISPDIIIESLTNTSQISFETTDDCNLNCKYCGYGELYGNYDNREKKNANIENSIALLEYMMNLWKTNRNQFIDKIVDIAFYGGEPLINFDFIKKIVYFIKNSNLSNRNFSFSMTTNAILLDRYMDFLVENNFKLTISLDGNEYNHSYRVNLKGNPSFKQVVKNIDLLKNIYPKYFSSNVNFNSVLHNRNSVEDIYEYIYTKYGKKPFVGELNGTGVKPSMCNEFTQMYNNLQDSVGKSKDIKNIEKEMFSVTPSSSVFIKYLYWEKKYIYKNYIDLFQCNKHKNRIPTATCLPFSKRIFITVNGKILPCERIGHLHALGEIINAKVNIDYEWISNKYNGYFNKIKKQCSKCHNVNICNQCIFHVDNIENNPICNNFMSKKQFDNFLQQNNEYMEQFPDEYYRILREIELD